MTKEENLKKLNIIHEQIKNNKYRENPEIYKNYADGYFKLLVTLVDTFSIINDERILKSKKFIHDFYAIITNMKLSYKTLNDDFEFIFGQLTTIEKELIIKEHKNLYEKEEIRLERYIGIIHNYLKTLKLDYFYVYEWVSSEKCCCYVRKDWNENLKDFEITNILEKYKKDLD